MTALQTVERQQRDLIIFSGDEIDLIKNVIAKGATDDELKLFLHQCRRTGLDPLAKQIYFQKRRNNKTGKETMTIITAIDGHRLVADRTGLYAGNDDPVFDNESEPNKATVTVYKIVGGIRCPFTATARWDEYVPYDDFMWKKMPCHMLGKCAEGLALRKAFPAELSGLYTDTEMQQADRDSSIVVPSDLGVGSKPTLAPAVSNLPPAQEQPKKIGKPFHPNNKKDAEFLAKILENRKVDSTLWEAIGKRMEGRTIDELATAIREVEDELSGVQA